MHDWETISAELAKPLDSRHVRPPQQYGPKGDYIEAWHAQAEANRIFGFNGWNQYVMSSNCVMETERKIGKQQHDGWGVSYIVMVQIMVDGISRQDFGAGHGYDRDLGLAHESAIKEAVSDAMKRALKSFGNPFGLALYDKERTNVQDVAAEEAAAQAEARAVDDARAAIMSAINSKEVDETVAKLVKKFGGKDKVPAAIRNIVAVKRAELEGKAG